MSELVAPVAKTSGHALPGANSPDPLPRTLHIALHGIYYTRKLAHAVATLLRSPPERELLVVIGRRDKTLAGRLLVDLMKLETARLAARGAVDGVAGLSAGVDDGTLTLMSAVGDEPRQRVSEDATVHIIRWDHSAVGPTAHARTRFGSIPYNLRPDGVYSFAALQEASLLAPSEAYSVISGFVAYLRATPRESKRPLTPSADDVSESEVLT